MVVVVVGGDGGGGVLRGGSTSHNLVTRPIAPRAARRVVVGVPRHGRITSRVVLRRGMGRRRRGGRSGSSGSKGAGRRSRTSLQHRNRASLLRYRLDQCSHGAFSSRDPTRVRRVLWRRRSKGRRMSTTTQQTKQLEGKEVGEERQGQMPKEI